ncbi:MAG TPA: flagellar hook-basal body protein [Opitutaceae bacterium]
MNIGLYQSAASLSALERWQDAVAQNITSSQVTGFKRRTVQMGGNFSGEVLIDPKARVDAGEGRPAVFPTVRYGISFAPGESQPTRRELDLALSGEGFFSMRMPDGQTAYTRAGQLQVRSDRTLVNSAGLEILSDAGAPIQLLPTGGTVVVDENGVVSQGDTPIGRLGIANFERPEALTPLSAGLFLAPEGVDAEEVDKPGVLQGHLEASNTKPLQEMVDLVNIARAYEANQKMITSRDELLQRTLESLT